MSLRLQYACEHVANYESLLHRNVNYTKDEDCCNAPQNTGRNYSIYHIQATECTDFQAAMELHSMHK